MSPLLRPRSLLLVVIVDRDDADGVVITATA
jgi:hypothetical protein